MSAPEVKPDDWDENLERFVDPQSGAETYCVMWQVPAVAPIQEEEES
jgi:hypothetical protein